MPLDMGGDRKRYAEGYSMERDEAERIAAEQRIDPRRFAGSKDVGPKDVVILCSKTLLSSDEIAHLMAEFERVGLKGRALIIHGYDMEMSVVHGVWAVDGWP